MSKTEYVALARQRGHYLPERVRAWGDVYIREHGLGRDAIKAWYALGPAPADIEELGPEGAWELIYWVRDWASDDGGYIVVGEGSGEVYSAGLTPDDAVRGLARELVQAHEPEAAEAVEAMNLDGLRAGDLIEVDTLETVGPGRGRRMNFRLYAATPALLRAFWREGGLVSWRRLDRQKAGTPEEEEEA